MVLFVRWIGHAAYNIDLPFNVCVHPIFYVSCWKEVLRSTNQLVSSHDLTGVEDLSFVSHEPKMTHGFREDSFALSLSWNT